MASLELGNPHLKTMMNFFVVSSYESLIVEVHNKDVDNSVSIKKGGIERAANSAKTF